MKTLILIFVLLLTTCLYSTIINIPADQPTIQEGIDVSVNADTVLVQPGTYVENINYNGKLITVASLFLTTQDTIYISQTVIDGNEDGSVVTFESGEDETAVFCGFTITNGISSGYYIPGGGIRCYNSSPSLVNLKVSDNSCGIYCDSSSPSLIDVTISDNNSSGGIYCCDNSNPILQNVTIINNSVYYSPLSGGSGGGIYCYESSPILENVTISGNNAVDGYGGGIYCWENSNLSLTNVTITGNTADNVGGGIYCRDNSSLSFDPVDRCNIFLNFAGSGCDLYASDCPIIDVIVDTFTVLQPDYNFAYPIDNFTFDILNAKIEQVDQDLYVSPNGSDDNSGLTIDNPLLTISYALIKILPDSINTLTIHLSNGTYSPSGTGEKFSLNCRSYVSLLGEDEASTILDGEGLSHILFCENDNNISIEDITIQNGNYGIICNESSPSLSNVTISGNSGSGIRCSSNSSPNLENVTISGNSGSGIHCSSNSSPSLLNVTITGNTSSHGGGIRCNSNSNPSLVNVTITGNNAGDGGGIYCYEDSSPSLMNVTITGNSAGDGGGICCVWISNPCLENVTITGNSAEYGGGIYFNNSSPSLENITITDNSADDHGGGIYLNNSSPSLENITITGNSAADHGGGIYCHSSSPSFSVDNRCSIYSNTIGNARGSGTDIFADECDTIHVIVDTFTVMTPTDYYASPINNFTFDILHSVVDSLINADVYVSVDGDDSNSGTSPDFPFKTINHALGRIYSDSLNINTIHLAPGVYSNSTNGEIFPIHWSNYVNLSANSEEETILDAESTSSVMGFYAVTNAIISNITITNGDGGISCSNSSPSFVNVIISGNNGSGIRCSRNSNPYLENVAISGNSTTQKGGGLYCYHSSPILENVTISGNSAFCGGGIYCLFSNLNLTNVTITGNSASNSGGGIGCYVSSPYLMNVNLTGNSASYRGGGIYCNFVSNPSLGNVTIIGNTADYGGGIYCCDDSNPSLVNCISYNNLPQEVYFHYGGTPNSITISYSDIQGGEAGIITNNTGTVYWLEGNIDADPLFVETGDHPFMLQDLSPCVNTGIPDTTGMNLPEFDLAGNPRVYGGRIDMGAYENQNVIVNTDGNLIPLITKLNQNYPNPFNPTTTINYSLKEDSKVSLNIYNIKGQKVKQLISEQLSAGRHSVIWNGTDNNGKTVSSGIYFYKLKTDSFEKTKKMILMK